MRLPTDRGTARDPAADKGTPIVNELRTSRLGERAGRVGARLVVLLFATLALGQTITEDFAEVPSWTRALGVVLVLLSTAGVMLIQSATIRRHVRRSTSALVLALLLLAWLDVLLTGAWAVLALAVAGVMSMPWAIRTQALVLVLLGAAAVAALARLYGALDAGLAFLVVIAALGGFVIHSMTRLVVVVDELRIARGRLARLQVDQERERISRDLHDILGRTLVAVSLRNETALRLLGRDDDACRTQITELQSTVIGGQAQLRALTSGPTLVGLSSEPTSAQDLLARLEVRFTVDAVDVEDPAVDQAFAAVVRESVTNMLKHSRPTMCRIGIRRESLAMVLTIVNDHALPAHNGTGSHTGSATGSDTSVAVGGRTGLRDLESRVNSLGGVMTAGPAAGGHFRVIARVPVPESTDDDGSPAPSTISDRGGPADDPSSGRRGLLRPRPGARSERRQVLLPSLDRTS
ncbi:MAG: histidine kinase [Humibacillus sp.]|nr:histidine kinase [Humibacillus sp.]